MDRSGLVPCATRVSMRRRNSTPADTGSSNIGTERTTPVVGVRRASSSRMETVQRQFGARGFSSKVVDLLVAGNRLQFLIDLLASGKSYNATNIHRSMLSRTLGSIEGVQIGAHSLVVRLMRSCYHKNPPAPNITRCGTRVRW